jgi:serine/threonine protein phosphatase 1
MGLGGRFSDKIRPDRMQSLDSARRNNPLRWQVWPPSQKATPRIAEDMRIYAIGDVHGRLDLLQRMLDAIDESLASQPVKNAVQVFVGDYIDRGPNSREVIETLLARRRRHAMICLKGNHETYPIEFLKDPTIWSEWRRVGGVNTLHSYGLQPSAADDPSEQLKIAAAFGDVLPESHRRFLLGLPLSFTCGDYFFAHAGARPGVPLAQQREHDLLWIRDEFLLNAAQFEKVVVHGHTPGKKVDIRTNRINIDTGAYATGRLTCLVLQGDQMSVI